MPPKRPSKQVIVIDDDSDGPPSAKRPNRGTGGQGASVVWNGNRGGDIATGTNLTSGRSITPGLGGSRVYPVHPVQHAYPSASQSAPSDSQVEEPEQIDLTQTDDGPQWEPYGTLSNKIVGIRFYNGYASAGEFVICRREPGNPYDSNAIRVDNVLGQQVGHLPRKVAEKLAPYIDRNEIVVEAMLASEKGVYDCPVRLTLLGPADPAHRARLEQSLKDDKLLKATQLKQTRAESESHRKIMGLKAGSSTVGLGRGPGQPDSSSTSSGPGSGPESGPSVSDLLQGSEVTNFCRNHDAFRTLALDEAQLEKMPLADQPAAVAATLLPYQLQGLAWMRAKEDPHFPPADSSDLTQLWGRDTRGRYANAATNFVSTQAPRLLSGGILADDMGLGKTLQVISLIMSSSLSSSSSSSSALPSGPTLTVAPVTVMSNWAQQIARHVRPERAPRLVILHGSKKLTAKELAEDCDVVVTSYGKLAAENKAGGDGSRKAPVLSAVHWRRVVLDEGHTIRNARTETAIAACQLKAHSRWVLTGTPIINNIKDLHSLVKFLGITGGLEQLDLFNALITRPLALGSSQAEALLQMLMRDLCLRRRKDMKFVDLKLPPKTEYVHRITFRPDEQVKYDALLSEARGALEEYQAKSASGQKGRFQSVLERLLRLRQTCNHWMLCKQRIDDLLKLLEDDDVVPFTPKNRAILQQALQLVVDSQEDCPICYDAPLRDPVITLCKHVFCRTCIARVIELQKKCPMCRNELSEMCLVEPAVDETADSSMTASPTDAGGTGSSSSSKTDALVQIVRATLREPKSKLVVFSQWTSFLDLVGAQLGAASVPWVRVDGAMSAGARDAAISALERADGVADPHGAPRVLLASLGVCSVGLNLTTADTVVLADSWWAPAIEDQAVDRVHRLGQTRKTTVWRLVVEGTVEERVLDVQAEKRELVGKAFKEDGAGNAARGRGRETRMTDLTRLLG